MGGDHASISAPAISTPVAAKRGAGTQGVDENSRM